MAVRPAARRTVAGRAIVSPTGPTCAPPCADRDPESAAALGQAGASRTATRSGNRAGECLQVAAGAAVSRCVTCVCRYSRNARPSRSIRQRP